MPGPPGQGMSTGVKFGIGALVLLMCLGFILFGLSMGGVIGGDSQEGAPKSEDAPPKTSAAPAAVDPRAPVWSSGQKIQGDPLEIGSVNAPVPFAVKPVPYTPGQPSIYTMSFDLYVTGDIPEWRNIFAHSAKGDDNSQRAPSVYLSGTTDAAPPRRVHYNHYGAASLGSVQVPLNKWYNITIKNDGSTAQVYMDGTLDSAATFTKNFTWPVGDDPWSWHNSRFPPSSPSLKVANSYFWPSVLTDAQIANLKIPTTDAKVPTTSYYSIEPYTP